MKVGTIEFPKDFEYTRSGETACNWTKHLIHAGTYDVELKWYKGRAVLVAIGDESILESYYENRVFTATRAHEEKWERGKNTGMRTVFRWGDHNYTTNPFDAAKFMGAKLKLEKGVLTADVRGYYEDGRLITFYKVNEPQEAAA